MKWVACSTQEELDVAVKNGDGAEVSAGSFTASGSATVTAYGSATVTAYGSATVTASGSATVTAYDSATVRASDSATVRASDSATVTAYGSATVTASSFVAVHIHSKTAKVVGGVVIRPKFTAKTAALWCKEHHVKVVRGIATVYKAVRSDFKSSRGGDYSPGVIPEAADWDGGRVECGGGLHFSPHPLDAWWFDEAATRFLVCKVRLTDMRVPRDTDQFPHKIKAKGCCAPCVECDRTGKVLEVSS